MTNTNKDNLWSSRIKEFEIDPSWKEHPVYKTEEYKNYRKKWNEATQGKLVTDFPLNIELEPTYYCNLKCPACPRYTSDLLVRDSRHMKDEIWNNILKEIKENKLPSMQMDHEAESLMHPKFFKYLEDTKKAGLLETWLHSNGMMVNEKNAKKLIDFGIKKMNFSIDAASEKTYEILRVGGKYTKVVKNILNFLKIKKEMKASYLRVRVSFVEQKENFSEKKAFFDFWSKQEGINVITFQRCLNFKNFEKPDDDTNLTETELEEKYKGEKPFFCNAPWETPIIQEDGKISPCGMPVRPHNNDFFIGDISKGDTIKECWNGKKMKNLRIKHKNNEWYKENMCRVCVKITRTSQHEEF
ncbi:MAG: hypothetical protein CBD57_04105 [Candidatus Pelagibacter sp. TMED197]|nr:MAG: hypothetical protein CBD57_04105 [Candidatus Pelagibacter sp. TMED197]